MTKKARCLTAFGVVFLIIIVAFIIGSMSEDEKKPIPTKTEVQTEKVIKEEISLEVAVERIVVDVMGKTVNWSGRPQTVKKIKKIKQVAGADEGGYLVQIEYRANENLTAGLTKIGIISDVMDFTRKLYSNPSCLEAKIYMLMPYLILVDKYGNKSEEQVGKLVLRRAIANKINWQNIFRENFERILRDEGQLWLHPALRG